jgi:DNA-binding transcriptional regulator YbjK
MREPLQERGRRRRDALLDAAVALLEEGGFAAISHRAVAERASVPLGATTYYFRSRDALLTQAFERLVEREVGAWHRRLADLDGEGGGTADAIEALPGVLLPAGEEERARQLALWELYLHAGRDPALRRPARAWTEGCIAAAAELARPAGYPPEAVRLLVVSLQGVLLQNLVEARPDAAEFTKYAVATLLQVLNQPGYHP